MLFVMWSALPLCIIYQDQINVRLNNGQCISLTENCNYSLKPYDTLQLFSCHGLYIKKEHKSRSDCSWMLGDVLEPQMNRSMFSVMLPMSTLNGYKNTTSFYSITHSW